MTAHALPASGLPPLVTVVVLAAALLHAVWNAIAHSIPDRLTGFALIGVTYTVGGGAAAVWSGAPGRESWPFLAGSVGLHVLTTLLLVQAYRLGDFGQAYPLARGTAPWLVAVAGATFAGEHLSALQVVGLLAFTVGLGVLALAGGRAGRTDRRAVAVAVLTGVAIASYSTVDGLGARQAGAPFGYIAWLFLLQGPVLPALAWARFGPHLARRLRPHLSAGLLGGVLSLLAYGLVIWAQTRGPLAPISALRETSVVMGALISAVVLHEGLGRSRLLAAALVALGAVLVTV